MYKNTKVEAEHNELILKNNHGDHVIVPANKRLAIKQLLSKKDYSGIDSFVEELPIASNYAEFGSVYSGGNPNEEAKNKEFKIKLKSKKKLSIEEAIDYAKINKLEGEELHQFLLNNVQNGHKLGNEKLWESQIKDPNYKIPVTEDEILNYQKHQNLSTQLQSDQTFNELKTFLEKNGYQKSGYGGVHSSTGNQIINNAKQRGVKVTQNLDGTYSMPDDVNTFTDTDVSFNKPRTFHPDATYQQQPYIKGKDIVNHYSMVTPPQYKNRVPTQEELTNYQNGETYVTGLTPEYKKVYIDKTFDPNGKGATLFNSQANQEDIQRYNEAKKISDNITQYKTTDEYKEKQRQLAKEYKNMPRQGQGVDYGGVPSIGQ